jgi:hypothetical protein
VGVVRALRRQRSATARRGHWGTVTGAQRLVRGRGRRTLMVPALPSLAGGMRWAEWQPTCQRVVWAE